MKKPAYLFLMLGLLLASLLALSGCGASGDVDAPGMIYFYATW